MDKQVIFDFIKQNGGAEVPSLQLQFNLSYKQARGIVSELVSSKCLEYYKGVTYVCVGKFVEKATVSADAKKTDCGRSFEDLDESMQQFLRKAEERRRKRVQQIFQQQQRQQQQQSDNEKLESEALAWLKVKMKDNSDFQLVDAKTKSEEELNNARHNDDQEAIQAQERICKYFKECSEFTFALLKLHAIA